MTPKNKAQELVNKFDESLNHLASGTNGIEQYIKERAIACAIIAVDEMQNTYVSVLSMMGYDDKDIKKLESRYLNEVKQELEKM